MTVAARRLGILPVRMPVGYRSAPWGSGEIHKEVDLFDSFTSAAIALEKAWNEDDHPRWPKKAPDSRGGRFTAANSGTGAGGPSDSTPGVGHNGGPPLDEIPPELPPTRKLINSAIKSIARWALKRGLLRLIPGIGWALTILDVASWIRDYLPYVNAYLDGPKTLKELNDAAGSSEPGYEIHHIVEQTSARKDGFSEEQIDSYDNRVRISTLKHWQITGWYNTRSGEFGGVTPRQYLRGKSWEDRRRVGLKALKQFGVLSP
jgi:hypothetical protein